MEKTEPGWWISTTAFEDDEQSADLAQSDTPHDEETLTQQSPNAV